MGRQRIAIVGAGGFAREVRWLIDEINQQKNLLDLLDFVGYVVSDPESLGEHDSRDQVIGDIQWLERGDADMVAIGIGTPEVRLRVGREIQKLYPSLNIPRLVHPSVRMDWQSAKIGVGAIICAGTIGTVNIAVDDFAMINLACTLGHECHIGKGTVLNPTVNISGGVIVGDSALVGTGTQILQYLKVGENSIIGAGAVVNRDIPANVIAVGIPARPIKTR